MLISNLREELITLIRNDREIADAIRDALDNSSCMASDLNNTDIILKNPITDLETRIQAEIQEKEFAENENKIMKNKLCEMQKKLEGKEVEMQRSIESKDAEYQALLEKYHICKDNYDSIMNKYNDFKLKYSDLDLIYCKYLSLGSSVIRKLERVLNSGIEPCGSPELFLAYGIQENNIVALWESIATNIDFYNSEGKTGILIDIFEYFINSYKEVTFKSVTINRPDEGDTYDERIHTRTASSNAIGEIQEILLPGFSIGKNITKKALVVVK